jgi:hypothetical protein
MLSTASHADGNHHAEVPQCTPLPKGEALQQIARSHTCSRNIAPFFIFATTTRDAIGNRGARETGRMLPHRRKNCFACVVQGASIDTHRRGCDLCDSKKRLGQM